MAKLTYSRDFLLRFADTNHFLPISTNHDLLQELLSLKDGKESKSPTATIATATYAHRKDTLVTKQHRREPGHPEPEHTALPKSRNPRPRPRSLVTPTDLVAAVAATSATPDIKEPGPGPGTFDKSARRSSLSMVENGRLLRAHARITQQNQQLQNENTELRRGVEGMTQEMEGMMQKVKGMMQKVEGMAQEVAKLWWIMQQENQTLKKKREDVVTRPRTTSVATTGVVGFGVRKGGLSYRDSIGERERKRL